MLPASKSPVSRDAKPKIRSRPPKNSSPETKCALNAGKGIPRLAKKPVIFARWSNLPKPVCANCHPQYSRMAEERATPGGELLRDGLVKLNRLSRYGPPAFDLNDGFRTHCPHPLRVVFDSLCWSCQRVNSNKHRHPFLTRHRDLPAVNVYGC